VKKHHSSSELRQDLTSGEWILFPPPKRGKRPHQLKDGLQPPDKESKKSCIFENPQEAGGGLITSYPDNKHWRLQVVPNKFPVVRISDNKAKVRKDEYFSYIQGFGHHELVITRGHDANFPKLSIKDANLLLTAFQERYREIAKDKNTAYISIFHNWGKHSGASIYHPHYQILSTPVLPPTAERSLNNARRYRRKNKKCVHCVQLGEALERKDRIIYEDELSVAFAPYAPREPFEFRVSPKGHTPFFEDATEYEIHSMIKSMQGGLKKLEKKIKHASYNFYLHTAPTKRKGTYDFYHWHIEVVPRELKPRLGMAGGFELATGIEVNPVRPEEATKVLNSRL